MTRAEFAAALEAHARELELALQFTTTRIEHIRVSALAREARRLSETFNQAGSSSAA